MEGKRHLEHLYVNRAQHRARATVNLREDQVVLNEERLAREVNTAIEKGPVVAADGLCSLYNSEKHVLTSWSIELSSQLPMTEMDLRS